MILNEASTHPQAGPCPSHIRRDLGLSYQADRLHVAAGLPLLMLGRLGDSKLPTGSAGQTKLCHFLLGSRCWALEALQRKPFVRKKHSRTPAPKDWLQGSAGSKETIASNEGGIWEREKV